MSNTVVITGGSPASRSEKDRSLDEENLQAELETSLSRVDTSIPTWKWALVCLGLAIGAFLYGLDTTISADVQGPILESLGEINKLAWVGIGFPMGSVAVILLIGHCYDLFQVKYMYICSVVVFEVGSAVCGAAPSMNAMIVGRIIAGIGGAGIYLGALTYFSVFTTSRTKPIYNAMLGISWGLGSILGPLIGGGFAASPASWRWAFYINLPLAAVMLPIHIFLLPLYNPTPSVSGMAKLLQIDWLGAVLNVIVFTLFVVVLTLGGSTWSWELAGPITLWVILGISTILYVLQQAFAIGTSPTQRLFPTQFLRSRTMVLLYTGTAAAITGLVVPIYYLPLFFQFTRGDSAIQAAVRLLPFICTFFFFIMLTGILLPILGRYNGFYIVAGAFYIAGGALMHTVKVDTSTATIYGFSVVAAVGAGMILQTGYDIASAKVKTGHEQAAVGFINVAQIGSAAICLAIAGSLFQNIGYINLKYALAPYGLSEEQIRGALSGASFPTGDAVIQGKAVAAVVETIGTMWILVVVAGAVSLVSGLLMRWEKIDLSAMEIRVLG